MAAKANRVVLIIMAYQPCNMRRTLKGKFTIHAQQSSLLQEKYMDDPKPNPRKFFRQDLTTFLKSLKAKGDNLILLGNFNEVLGNGLAGMSKLCRELVLSYVTKMQHETSDTPATYAQATKQLDYILMSEQCAVSIQKCGYKPFNHRMFSNHCAMFVNMDMEMLFGNSNNVLPTMQHWDFKARDPKAISNYLTALNSYFKDHNFCTKDKIECFKKGVKERLGYSDLGKLKKPLRIWYEEKFDENREIYMEATMPKMVSNIVKLYKSHTGKPVKESNVPATPGECTYK